MATYARIQGYVRRRCGFTPKTCWIAHCKELAGLPLDAAWNRDGERKHPCPVDKRESIMRAFRRLGLIPLARPVGAGVRAR